MDIKYTDWAEDELLTLSPPYLISDLIVVLRSGLAYKLPVTVSQLQLGQGWATVQQFGGTGSGNETAVINAAEASSYEYINLCGLTITTTINIKTLTKNYFNGDLIGVSNSAYTNHMKPLTPFTDESLARRRSKSPIVSWAGLKILWLGTSIPAMGLDVNGYPEIFAESMGATVSNMAFGGSHATFDMGDNPFDAITTRALSMTEDDRLAGLAIHGSSSAYDDSFDINPASQQTADYRIKQKFAAQQFDVVFLDHNHNDSNRADGVLSPTPIAITSIAKGTTTVVTLAGPGLVALGAGVALTVTGIPKLNDAAGRVTAVGGNTFTLNINSTSYTGTFTAGTVIIYDRTTVFGAIQFLLHYIRNSAVVANALVVPKIILSGAPSEFTNDLPSPNIWSISNTLRDIGDKWNLAFFDIAWELEIGKRDHIVYLPDTVHPTTPATRQVIAAHWVSWAHGGVVLQSVGQYLPRGGSGTFIEQREALYSRLDGGFTTRPYIVGIVTNVITENFSAGLGAWTTFGTAPVIEAAPWDASKFAIKCVSTLIQRVSMIFDLTLPFNSYWSVEFDIMFPIVLGLATADAKTMTICEIFADGTPPSYYRVAVIAITAGVFLNISYFPTVGGAVVNVTSSQIYLEANVKYHLKIEAVRAGAGYDGSVIASINNVSIVDPHKTIDASRSSPTGFRIGVIASNTVGTVEIYIGTIIINNAPVVDYTNRFTGTFLTPTSQTVSVVNGLISSVV